MLWSGSETPEHQQVRFRNTRTPAGCEHTPRKTHAKKLFHVTFGTHKKQALLWSGSETPMPKNSFTSPLEAIENNALPMRKTWTAAGQKPCSGWSCGWSCNGSFGGSSGLRSARSRNSQTPAGFKPNLSKNQPPKNYLTSPSDAHKKDEEGQRQCLTSPDRQLRKHEKTTQKPCSGWSCGWSCRLQWHLRWQLRPPFGTEPKQPNPSRIQAQPVQKPAPEKVPKNSFTSPLEPIKNNKKQCFGTVPKHPNWSGSETPEH